MPLLLHVLLNLSKTTIKAVLCFRDIIHLTSSHTNPASSIRDHFPLGGESAGFWRLGIGFDGNQFIQFMRQLPPGY